MRLSDFNKLSAKASKTFYDAIVLRGKTHCTSGEITTVPQVKGLYFGGRNVVPQGKKHCTSGEEMLYLGGNRAGVSCVF